MPHLHKSDAHIVASQKTVMFTDYGAGDATEKYLVRTNLAFSPRLPKKVHGKESTVFERLISADLLRACKGLEGASMKAKKPVYSSNYYYNFNFFHNLAS